MEMKMRACLFVLLLAGCARQPMSPEQIIETYAPICDKLGFTPNTDPWRNCVLSRYDAAMQDRASRRAAAIGARNSAARNCTFIGNQMTCN